MPHRDTYSHPFGGQAVDESPTEETRTAEHHNRGHDLLRHAVVQSPLVAEALGQNLL